MPPVVVQPVAADDVAAALANVAVEEPLNGTIELAGPEPIRLDELVRRFLSADRDARKVTTDLQARYFGTELNDQSLTPGDNPRIGPTRFEDWLSRSVHGPERSQDMKNQRVNLGKTDPELYQTVYSLERQVSVRVATAGIDEGFAHLLRLRASQLNGCAYCVRMHARDALASGESTDRISLLPAWRETGYFTDKEQAFLALIEAVTCITEGQVPDSVYDRAASVLSKDEIAAVEWLGVVINAWNRIAISSRIPVQPNDSINK